MLLKLCPNACTRDAFSPNEAKRAFWNGTLSNHGSLKAAVENAERTLLESSCQDCAYDIQLGDCKLWIITIIEIEQFDTFDRRSKYTTEAVVRSLQLIGDRPARSTQPIEL